MAKSAADAQVSFLTALVPYREGEAPKNVETSVQAEGECRRFTLKVGGPARSIRVDMTQKTARFE